MKGIYIYVCVCVCICMYRSNMVSLRVVMISMVAPREKGSGAANYFQSKVSRRGVGEKRK